MKSVWSLKSRLVTALLSNGRTVQIKEKMY